MADGQKAHSDVARDALIAAIRRDFDLGALVLPEEYTYASLPLCVIDAVFSIGVTYESTRRTVLRWCAAQHPAWDRLRGPASHEHTLVDFLGIVSGQSVEHLAGQVFQNRQRTSSRSGILKVEAVIRFAEVLVRHGITKFGDIDDAERNAGALADIKQIPGQGSGLSWDYFLMLAGSEALVKTDRMVCRYVTQATGAPEQLSTATSKALLLSAVAELGRDAPAITPRAIDYAIWSLQRQAA